MLTEVILAFKNRLLYHLSDPWPQTNSSFGPEQECLPEQPRQELKLKLPPLKL